MIPFVTPLADVHVPKGRWLLLLAPMMLDALFNDIGFLSSTLLSRVGTGILAGAILVLFILPSFLEAVRQLRNRSSIVGEKMYVRKA